MGLVFSLILAASAAGASATLPLPDDCSIIHSALDSSSDGSAIALNQPQRNVTPMVTAGGRHTVGLKSDGTVLLAGLSDDSLRCRVSDWTDILAIAVGWGHTVGLKSDGTVVAVGWNDYRQCNVGGWTDIVRVAAADWHTVGLKSDGTVVAVGRNDDGQCDVGGWTNIIQVAAGQGHTVGLKSDGTVVAVGCNAADQCDVGGWTNIVQVAAGECHTVGLKSDGTVVAVGCNAAEQCDVGGWTNIVQVAAGRYHTVGLKSDGTVVAVGENMYGQCNVGGWTNIVQVAAGEGHTVALKSDGTVVAVGDNRNGQCSVSDWNLLLALPPPRKVQPGIKAGDWIEIDCEVTGWPARQPYTKWQKLEFTTVEGTQVTARYTARSSDGTEYTRPGYLYSDLGQCGVHGDLSSYLVAANLTTGDYVYLVGGGEAVIEGETTRTYAGATRTVVYAKRARVTLYWDKLTGVVVESSATYDTETITSKLIRTNMWEATRAGLPWWLWIIVVAGPVAALVIFLFRRRRVTPTRDG